MTMQTQQVDFLVIGGGVAGLRAAIELGPHGTVAVVTKDVPTESSTEYAQGGIAVALSDEDEVGIHYEDTIKAGAGLCMESAVRILVEEGPRRIQELIDWGAEFDKDGTKLSFTLEAAHSRKRVLHAHGDATGKELLRVLTSKARSFDSITRHPSAVVMDLVLKDGRCMGAYVLEGRSLRAVLARATILATGGAGQVYSVTTNPQVATADGMGVAARAGAEFADMEFVQFHPTSLYHPTAPHFLLSEAMRGEGAKLKNINMEPFMHRYHESGELASRDIVSRAIISEIERTGGSHVYLDMTHMDSTFLKNRFPKIHATCRQYGVDITSEPVPVSPAMHYIMGGVKTDSSGRTSIEGLYAAGEVACTGIHGANRLASNSLLEGLVYGARAGAAAATAPPLPSTSPSLSMPTFHTIAAHDEIRGSLRRLMWENVGIIRSETTLKTAMRELSKWRFVLANTYMTRRELELKNMIQTAILITESALSREDSVGAHYRSDEVLPD